MVNRFGAVVTGVQMRLDTTAEVDQFRAQVRQFIAENAPGHKTHTGVRAPDAADVPAIRRWTAALYDAGYLGIDWPEQWGGRPDAHPMEAFVVSEELARARVWSPIGAGSLAAGALIDFGTDAQRSHYLPRIRSGEDIWCQLFSEPGAGSDLASLQTRAVLDGEHYVVNGQKVWTTNGQHADVGYLLARTDPDAKKQAGITAFAVDMRTPGIDVRPLREITGSADFNEVFLDDVRVPVDNVIGEVNGGWRVATTSLVHERHQVGGSGVELLHMLSGLAELATAPRNGGTALDDDTVREELGRLYAETLVNTSLNAYTTSRMIAGVDDPADAPTNKVFFSELNLAMAEFGVRLQGTDGILVESDPAAVADGWWQDAFMYARAYTIAGGANEVLRNLIAERSLGLPRDK
jgi:alkylation response protein AidB-like acyl-CoA dehydrogenase